VTVSIRPEVAGDFAATYALHRRAFGRAAEADLVVALRAIAEPQIALVAADATGAVVGHVFFSPVALPLTSGDGHESAPALGLAPLAVVPELQRRGIAGRLITAGLAAARALGQVAVVVLGAPGLYERFGFVPAHTRALRCEFPAPPGAFMVAELVPDVLVARSGVVRYLPPFTAVDTPAAREKEAR
jgi:putative acetyltransferase